MSGQDPMQAAYQAEKDLNSHEAKAGHDGLDRSNRHGKPVASSADESGVNSAVENKFPGSTVTYGSAASGAGDNREIPDSEGGGINPSTGRQTKAKDFEGVGGPEDKIEAAQTERGGDQDVVGNTRQGGVQSYQLFLMAGGNSDTNMQQLQTLVATGTFSTLTASAIIQPGVGGSTANAYFLKMISVSKEGGQIINYSSRFTLTGMTGVFGATVQQGITAVGSNTAGPPTVNQVANNAAGTTAAAAGAAQFTVPYQLQTGLTKYAPMQPVPGTKITATAFTPLHPTSAYTLATTYMGTPIVATTLTMSQTFSVSSMENTVAAASAPTGDMAKFLARWKD